MSPGQFAQPNPDPPDPPDSAPLAASPTWGGELAERMGITFVTVSPERVVATMPVVGNTQPYGLLHGGASCVLAETVGSVAAALRAGDENLAVGIEINATHHRSATSGVVTAEATAIHTGRTLVCCEIVITDEQQRRTCTARLTCLIRPRPAS